MTKQKQKYSYAMERAYAKLTNEWKCPYSLQESRRILDALVSRGLVEKSYGRGYLFSPRTSTFYRLKRTPNVTP